MEQKNETEAPGTLADGVAHDLNNMLTAVIVNIELALMGIPRKSSAAGHLRLALEAAEEGTKLVREIIVCSRPSGRKKEVVEISSVVRKALRFLRSALPSNIKIVQRIRSGTGAVLANPSQIYQILVNLCTNAADAMGEEGGVLRVHLENSLPDGNPPGRSPGSKPGDHVKLTVSDTGCGMSESMMKRMYKPFFSTKDKSRRSGMGLTVVHGIVGDQGGFINVRSVEGMGTVFKVFFPRVKDRPAGSGRRKRSLKRRTPWPGP